MALHICTLHLQKEGLQEKHEGYYFSAAFLHIFIYLSFSVFFFSCIFSFFF